MCYNNHNNLQGLSLSDVYLYLLCTSILLYAMYATLYTSLTIHNNYSYNDIFLSSICYLYGEQHLTAYYSYGSTVRVVKLMLMLLSVVRQ